MMALSMYSSMAFVSLVDGGKFGCDEVWLQLINQYYCHRGDWGKGGGGTGLGFDEHITVLLALWRNKHLGCGFGDFNGGRGHMEG